MIDTAVNNLLLLVELRVRRMEITDPLGLEPSLMPWKDVRDRCADEVRAFRKDYTNLQGDSP